jgi:hypothetical protein
MSNIPPTFNDLKRRRNLYNLKRGGRTVIGSSISLPISIPSLDAFINEIIFFETQTDYIGSGNGLITEDGKLYGNSKLGNPLLLLNGNPYYSGATLSATTGFTLKSLYFVDDVFKSKSINFDFPIDQVKNFSLRRDFYNTSGVATTSTFGISVFDFDSLNVTLSTDSLSVIGTNDEFIPLNIVSDIQSGRLIEEKTNFKLDFGPGGDLGQSTFTALPNIQEVNYTFNEPFTGTNILTLSTIRNDGFASGLHIDTVNIDVSISLVFNINRIQRKNIFTVWQTVSSAVNPDGDKEKFRFLNFAGLSGNWNTEWWGYSGRDIYNFSGVSYKARGDNKPGGLEDENNLVLITPKHAVCNTHFSTNDDPQIGDTYLYYNHNTSTAISGTVLTAIETGIDDITVVKFNENMQDLGCKIYNLPRFDNPILHYTFATIYQGGNGDFGTGETDAFAGLGSHNALTDVEGTPLFPTIGGSTAVGIVSSVFSNTFLGLSSLGTGDSSSPTFIPYDNDILLASGFTNSGGQGPNYGLSSIQTVLLSAINETDIRTNTGSDNFTFNTVRLS